MAFWCYYQDCWIAIGDQVLVHQIVSSSSSHAASHTPWVVMGQKSAGSHKVSKTYISTWAHAETVGTFKAHIITFGYLEYVITKSGTTREEPSSQLGYFVPMEHFTGFFKKKQPSTGNHIDTLITPRNPQLQCCSSEVPSTINRNVFFLKLPSTQFRNRQHWIGGRGRHDLYALVLHRSCFLKNTVTQTLGNQITQKWHPRLPCRKWWRMSLGHWHHQQPGKETSDSRLHNLFKIWTGKEVSIWTWTIWIGHIKTCICLRLFSKHAFHFHDTRVSIKPSALSSLPGLGWSTVLTSTPFWGKKGRDRNDYHP